MLTGNAHKLCGKDGSAAILFKFGIQTSIGKAIPLQSWSGPDGSRKLRFPDFMTTAQDGGKVVSLKTYQLKGKAVPL